ncbi:hypothetical protein D6D19_04975 [Aureobasidium pullulans]|uniref:F-box domain-containing protein n=1 Tax=Aureobasidium pullulans TaxID=5580 RepID=A0A4S9ARM7_AURPU|nr:hypothetical protein D6D19_04975 [Aureobasidium pullulans]THW82645.1 hypothetical protein D6D17_09409 [Aureobasidium pullulans]THX48781.1 hypothetical protein D6D06_08917 [Aureobasidium pullulans]THX88667.1 hypothetical protein D6D05_01633 [Aureobasidium pullulans]THY29244.1 hypothetical protein D6D00_03734 [Aureobasidium pullulans]
MPPDPGSGVATAIQRQGADPEVISTPFRFLDLPAEIRLRILKYALTDGTRASTVDLYRDGLAPHSVPSTDLNAVPSPSSSTKPNVRLLLTNRQINAEGTPILYSKNTFSTCPSALERFTKAVGAANRQHISSIHINGATTEPYFAGEWSRSLKEYIGLKRLRLNVLPRVYYWRQFAIGPHIDLPGAWVLPALLPVIKMLCRREGSENAARKIIEVLPFKGCDSHELYVWSVIPCIHCCHHARFFEEYKVAEDDFWSDIPKRYAEAKELARREKQFAERLVDLM